MDETGSVDGGNVGKTFAIRVNSSTAEHRNVNPGDVGSNPTPPAKEQSCKDRRWGVKVLVFGRGSWGGYRF